jgi:hypothetical protein
MRRAITRSLLLIFAGCSFSAAIAIQKPSILDEIARSVPRIDPAWEHVGTESHKTHDGATQASIKWKRGANELGATVVVHATVKSAKRAFLPSGKEDLQEAFRISGVGDEAFLWPPKTPEGGAYNIRFRKAQVEVWMGHASETDLRRYAQAIASAIPAPGNRKPNR